MDHKIGDTVRYLDTDDPQDLGVIRAIDSDNPHHLTYEVEFPDSTETLDASEFVKVDT